MNLSNFFYLKNELVVLPGREPPNEPIQVMDRDWKTIRIPPLKVVVIVYITTGSSARKL